MSSEIHFCSVCGSSYNVQKHHVVFKSQAKYMEHIKLDFKYLCLEHHKGDDGPHENRETDLVYKLEMQDKLFQLLSKDYYTTEQLSKIIKCSVTQATHICKTLKIYKEGYDKTEIIRRMMGGKLYNYEELEELRCNDA